MRRRSVLALATLGATACAAGDATIAGAQAPGPNTRIARSALESALKAVAKRDPKCRAREPHLKRTITHDPIPADMLATFGVLRRPKGAQDAIAVQSDFPMAEKIAVDYIRRAAVLSGGRAVYVIPALDARPAIPKRPAVCGDRERQALEHRLRGKPAPARRAARRELRKLHRIERAAARRTLEAGLFLLVRGPYSGFGGGGVTEVDDIRRYGSFVASNAGSRSALLVGLVPDGVAAIDFTFAAGHTRVPGSDRTYASAHRATAPVADNVVAVTVPRAPEDAIVNEQVWRAADGTVVNTVRWPPPYVTPA
ncbi:MAG TPA: hypothetical protein VF257_16100 [Solirubrobacteraceae bacterium]